MIIHDDIRLNYTSYGEPMHLILEESRYANGRLALQFWIEQEFPEPFAKVTVNLPEIHLNDGEVLIKDWAENMEFVDHLLQIGWLKRTGREVASGYVFPLVATLEGPLSKLSAQA